MGVILVSGGEHQRQRASSLPEPERRSRAADVAGVTGRVVLAGQRLGEHDDPRRHRPGAGVLYDPGGVPDPFRRFGCRAGCAAAKDRFHRA